ncbi:MAG: hypothetical protein ACLP7O_12175 [Terracidiphilus sp.]
MDIPYKPAIELVVGLVIWALGHALWGIRFTRQWYADLLKDQESVHRLVDIANQTAPLEELTRRMATRSLGSDRGENEVTEKFSLEIEAKLSETKQNWESHWQLLFAATFVLILSSLALSPYVLILNLCVALLLSRYLGGFGNVFSDAGTALLPVVKLITRWFKRDPSGCEEWCTVSHPEFQTAFAVIRSSVPHVGE